MKCKQKKFYDTRLIKIMLKTLNAVSIDIVLEVGCGQGTDAILISEYARNVVAIDISFNALMVAKKLSQMNNCYEKMLLMVADAEHLPFQDGVFDMVFCKDVLHHLSNSVLALSEMNRVTRTAGKVAAIEANAYNPQMIFDRAHLLFSG